MMERNVAVVAAIACRVTMSAHPSSVAHVEFHLRMGGREEIAIKVGHRAGRKRRERERERERDGIDITIESERGCCC